MDGVPYFYLLAAVCFILALKGLSSPATARQGNILGMLGMALAVIATLSMPAIRHEPQILLVISAGGLVGALLALKINMTAIPQLVAGFHSLVGLAAVVVAFCAYLYPKDFSIGVPGHIQSQSLLEMALGLIIGAVTFSGSTIAFLKLQGWVSGKPLRFRCQREINAVFLGILIVLVFYFIRHQTLGTLQVLALLSFIFGLMLVVPIGGADMPVVISMLNSYSGWAASGIGFTLGNSLLVITGALVGASGAILSYIMCKGMNRSLWRVIFGGGEVAEVASAQKAHADVTKANAEDAAFILSQAKDVIIVPGYGMAVARAQHALKELVDDLRAKNIQVRFAIHPVAGRMPGHMNVLLAEANIPYNLVFEQSDINRDFANCDVALVVGANDITNPAAKHDSSSPIYGMPVLDVGLAKRVLFIKRSLAPGYAGIDNDLFYQTNTYLLFGDAKQVLEAIVKELG